MQINKARQLLVRIERRLPILESYNMDYVMALTKQW